MQSALLSVFDRTISVWWVLEDGETLECVTGTPEAICVIREAAAFYIVSHSIGCQHLEWLKPHSLLMADSARHLESIFHFIAWLV